MFTEVLFTEVLLTPKDMHFSQGNLFFTDASSMELNIPFAIEAVDKHISRDCATTFCWLKSKSGTLTGFIFVSR